MAYDLYLDGEMFPVTPSKITVTYKNQNRTMNLIDGKEINFLNNPGLTDVQFDLLIPHTRYPFAQYPDGFKPAEYYLDFLGKLKKDRKTFQFILAEVTQKGDRWIVDDIDITVSLEEYKVIYDTKNGFDRIASIKLKQYKEYGTKTKTVTEIDGTYIMAEETPRATANAPAPKTYTVVAGDCLWNIARKCLGDGSRYKEIQNLNPDKIINPNLIYPGQVLTLPD